MKNSQQIKATSLAKWACECRWKEFQGIFPLQEGQQLCHPSCWLMAPLQPFPHGAATSAGTDGRMLTYFPKNCLGQALNPCTRWRWIIHGQEGFPVRCWIREEALQREGNPLQSPLAKETLLKHSQLSPSARGGVSMAILGAWEAKLSRVLRAMEQSYQCPGTAQLPFLAPHPARFCPEELHMATNWNLHLFWWVDDCFPFCRILVPLPQAWQDSATLSGNILSS